MKKKSQSFIYFMWILIFNYLGGYISSLCIFNPKLVYNSLNKPIFAVPSYVFPIVWGILYFILAIAATLDYRKEGKNTVVYVISMLISFTWTYVFFSQELYGISFIIIIIIMIFSIYLLIKYLKTSKIAAFIMFLYLIWLSYAALLNYFIWMYNEM